MIDSHTLRARVPGQSVMSEVVDSQRTAPVRGRVARFFGMSPLLPENRHWYRAALGELLVGDAVDNLGPEWDVLHAVPIGEGMSELDHLLIGPAGVFAISTRNHSKQEVVVAGDRLIAAKEPQLHIPAARTDAARAAELLGAAVGRPVPVTPVVVVVNPKKLIVNPKPADVWVVSSRQLVRSLQRADRRLDGVEVAEISDIADQDSTWVSVQSPTKDVAQLNRDFGVLRTQVSAAQRRRFLWASAAFLAICAIAWLAVAAVVVPLVLVTVLP